MSARLFSPAPTAIQVMEVGNPNPRKIKRIILGQAISNADGVATLYFTDTGQPSGTPLLDDIDYAVATVYSTNSTIHSRPRVQMREKNVNQRYVSANITNISGVTLLGITVLGSENPVNGAVVEFMIVGNLNSPE